jgi:putative flippase GtrA
MMNFSAIPLQTQILRFILGGLSTTVICFGSLLVLVNVFGIHYLVSANLATGIAFFYAYIVQKKFVFQNRENTHITYGMKFIALQVFLLGLGNGFLYTGVDILGFHYFLVTVVMSAFLAFLNFVLMKLLVFT